MAFRYHEKNYSHCLDFFLFIVILSINKVLEPGKEMENIYFRSKCDNLFAINFHVCMNHFSQTQFFICSNCLQSPTITSLWDVWGVWITFFEKRSYNIGRYIYLYYKRLKKFLRITSHFPSTCIKNFFATNIFFISKLFLKRRQNSLF